VVVEGNGGNDWKGGCGHPLFQGKVAPWGAGVLGMLGSRELRVLEGYCSVSLATSLSLFYGVTTE
jgi:hypothetical protein